MKVYIDSCYKSTLECSSKNWGKMIGIVRKAQGVWKGY